jgi:hypothetical protein
LVLQPEKEYKLLIEKIGPGEEGYEFFLIVETLSPHTQGSWIFGATYSFMSRLCYVLGVTHTLLHADDVEGRVLTVTKKVVQMKMKGGDERPVTMWEIEEVKDVKV